MTTQPFGEGEGEPVSFAAIAAQVRSIKPRALTPDQIPDVLDLIEYLQEEINTRHDQLTARSNELDAREVMLAKRERAASAQRRAAEMIVKGGNRRGKLLGYFKR